MTKIDYYCRRCHSQIERFAVGEVKNPYRPYVIYANWCPKCKRYIDYICNLGYPQVTPSKEECILQMGAPSCGEAEDGHVNWWCNHYVKEKMLSRAELEAGIV